VKLGHDRMESKRRDELNFIHMVQTRFLGRSWYDSTVGQRCLRPTSKYISRWNCRSNLQWT